MRPHDDRLDALAETAAALAGELNLQAILKAIVAAAARLTAARYAALGVIDEQGAIGQFITEGADEATIAAIGHYPQGKGLLGLLIRDPHILRLGDLHAHPASSGFPANHPAMTTFLGAPVRSGGTVYGNLYLTEKPGGFDAADERLVMVLAAQAGAAIENAQLSQRLQSLAVQDERDRISRDLHDGVIQTLFSIGMSLESARTLIATDVDRVEQRLSAAVDGLDDVIRELRNSIFSLRPQEAAALGLTRGIKELAREYEVNALVGPQLLLEPGLDEHVPEHVVADLLMIIREALSNVARHARARTVRIGVALDGGVLHLVVADDGAGFDLTTPARGNGLRNMTQRGLAIGGSLDVASQPGAGTQVRLELALEQEGP